MFRYGLLAIVVGMPIEPPDFPGHEIRISGNVRQNLERGRFVLRWARSATKHRISRDRSRFVIERSRAYAVQPVADSDARLIFLGEDRSGTSLEVIAVSEGDGTLLVIHAMPLRKRYRQLYEEMKRWES